MPNPRCTPLCTRLTGNRPRILGALVGSGSMLLPLARNPRMAIRIKTTPKMCAARCTVAFINVLHVMVRHTYALRTSGDSNALDLLLVDRPVTGTGFGFANLFYHIHAF